MMAASSRGEVEQGRFRCAPARGAALGGASGGEREFLGDVVSRGDLRVGRRGWRVGG